MPDNKKVEMLIPKYMKEFNCIGSACEDTCCAGWGVSIDKDTYKKYRSNRNEELKPILDDKVKRNRSSKSDLSYAKIILDNDSVCPFLDEKKLCRIQKTIGEEFLSVTCTTYPRTLNKLNGVIEKSGTMSCPEIARLALLKRDFMEFDQLKIENVYSALPGGKIDTHNIKNAYKLEKYLWELRIFTIQVLQNREYKIWERLIMLGMFYAKLDEYVKEQKLKEVPNLIASYTNNINDGLFEGMLDEIPSQNSLQVKLLKEILDERFAGGPKSVRYKECLTEFLVGIGYKDGELRSEIPSNYENAYRENYEPFMKDREHIYEHYLVNHVFKNMFPFSGEKDVFGNYMMMVIHYALIKMHLVGISAVHKENFSEEHIIKLIQSFSKAVEHDKKFLHRIHDMLKESGFDTMAYMAILIKN